MLATPGCCARDEMGALSRGVFWGVLMVGDTLAGEGEQKENCGGFIRQAARCGVEVSSLRWGEANTYGATGCSWRLLRMGSDMVADDYGRQKNCCVLCCKWMGRSASLRSTRTGARSAFSPGHPAKARYSLQEVPLGVRVPLYTLLLYLTSGITVCSPR